ncbi:MAG: protein-disulfide reductase DsbD [Proteobacteria bacterium]|nr:protein-disulfide reductase DsbD [Pseudomonadota bacterium]
MGGKECKHVKRLNIIFWVLLVFGHPAAYAESVTGTLEQFVFGVDETEFLHPDEAFQVSARIEDANTIVTDWKVVDGHYLYKDKIAVAPRDKSEAVLGVVQLPPGKEMHDEFFGQVVTIDHDFEADVPIRQISANLQALDLEVTYQGCAKAGLCYPPITKTLQVALGDANEHTSLAFAGAGSGSTPNGLFSGDSGFQSEQDRFAAMLASGKLWWIIASFLGLGLLLAFTPCVFPMIPILSSIIVGQGKHVSTSRAFGLSLVYVLAMAITYTVAGIVVGLSGENVQVWFQNPWVISTFVGILVLLSLSMFGLYELQIPQAIQSRLNAYSSTQRQGSYTGAGVMGFLSALIVGPCVNAPLIGALIYIADVGDATIGGLALFALSVGMGIPLLVVGTSAGKILPKAGTWMAAVKAVTGVFLLALAIWMLERIIPTPVVLLLSGALLIASSVYMGALETLREGASGWFRLWKGFGLIALVYGGILVIGAAAGSHSLLHPLQGIFAQRVATDGAYPGRGAAHSLAFRQIKGIEGLESAVQLAVSQGRPVMLDFYADWCISCKEMEAFTFSNAGVQDALQDFVLLQADVTDNDEQDRALLQHLGLFGPPAILFYAHTGQEMKDYRIVGFMGASRFTSHIGHFKNAGTLALHMGN